jgi:hypothetical protein
MRPRRLAVQLSSFILIISLAAGCGLRISTPQAAPSDTPDPNQVSINTLIQASKSVTLEQADQAEQDSVNLMRDQSGARAAFGDQAAAIFLKIDQDKAAALQEMVDKAAAAAYPPPKVSAQLVKPGTSGTTGESPLDKPQYMTRSMVQAFITMLLTTQASNPGTGNAVGDITEGGDPVGAAGTHYTFQPQFFGSRLEATGTITTIVTAPFAYQESIRYDLNMEACPDAQGNVPVHLSLHSAASLLGGGVQLGGESQVTGHVNDEGVRASTDYNTTYQGSRQPIHGVGENLGTVNTFFESQENVTLYTDPGNPGTGSQRYTRQSSETDEQFNHDVVQEMRLIMFSVTNLALDAAEKKWTTGYCVELQVPELGAGTKMVQPNSETPFTAAVRHKFENVDLQVPVIAVLSEGQVSVNPAGTKVPAPAAFIYKAPNTEGLSASVKLVTRSKRGIATLDLKFTTGLPTWTGSGTFIRTTSQAGAGAQVSDAYTFQVTFRVLSDGKVEGTGSLTLTEEKESLPGMTCNRPGVSSVIYPPLEVSGTVQLGTVSAPQAVFQLNFKSFPAVLPSSWVCDISGIPYTSNFPSTDGGFFLDKIEISAVDGAQARGGGPTYMPLVTTWELQIHKQAAP